LAKKKSSPTIQISRRGLMIWIGLVLFIAGWMFVLGILVGRGAAPVNIEVGKLEKELAELKAKMLTQQKARLAEKIASQGTDANQLGFYEELKSPKKKEPFRSLPQAKVAPRPSPGAPAASKSPRPSEPRPVVKPKAPPKSLPKQISKPDKVVQKGRFTIQVAASQDVKKAEKLVRRLRQKGFRAYQMRSEVAGKGVWYRVRIGAFENRGQANKMLAKLKAKKYDGMVVGTK
jgi:cell division septation protein DedD